MFRKIILAVATLAIICVVFAIVVWREDTGFRRQAEPPAVRLVPLDTQPATTQPVFTYEWARIPPGQAPKVRVYDPRTGEARIAFQARQWNPISENEFHLTQPSARVLLPGGQLAYVQADEGQIKVAGNDTRNLNPKNGWFKGHVRIFIDRSRPEWRQQNLDLAAPELHPEAVVRIWLDDARFDLDLDRLESDGLVRVQSTQGTLEGKGLELIWSEVDRKLRRLRIKEGHRATIRGAELGNVESLSAGAAPAEDQPGQSLLPFAQAAVPATQPAETEASAPPAIPAAKPAGPEQIAFQDQQARRVREDRVDSYELVFRDNIEARQIEGIKVAGSLKADSLTLLSDLGREERAAVEYTPGTSQERSPLTTIPTTAPQAKKRDTARASGGESMIELLWTGEVLIEPVSAPATQEAPTEGPKKKRFHLRADGNPVELVDAKQGRITCRRFEYHLENRQGWLTGTAADPVLMNAGPDRQVLVEDTLFFDQRAGLARITGPGRMVTRKSGTGSAAAVPAITAGTVSFDAATDMQIAWQDSGEISFERMKPASAGPSAKTTPKSQSAYLKEARFAGRVVAGMSDQSIAADRLDIVFLPPPPKAASTQDRQVGSPLISGDLIGGAAADHITAAINVRMTQRSVRQNRQDRREILDTVICDRLEVDMAVDETGRSHPRIGKALGHVLARQVIQPYLGSYKVGSPEIRDIRADDEITIELASVPRPVGEEEIEKLQVAARRLGYTPDSPQWKAKETELRNRRQLVRRRLEARGNVSARDTQQDLQNLWGRHLQCTFDADQKIDKALLVGTEEEPALVEQGSFYIRGRQLSLNMATETVEVPGGGKLRFYSDQDIDGRPMDKESPVVVTWDRQMWLRGNENLGLFEGGVTVTSENTRMQARELRLRFTPVAAPSAAGSTSRPAQPWLVGPVLNLVRSDKPQTDTSPLEPQRKRRLIRADAFGDVEIVSSSYQPADDTLSGRIARSIIDRLPSFMHPPASQPAEPEPGRLLSRIWLAGPQVRIDLDESQLLVEGPGNLLVEDYRIPPPGGARQTGSPDMFSATIVPGLNRFGPSQTLFRWQNSMSFLNRQNIATFDHSVTMSHASGTQMAMFGQLASALKLDEATRKRLTSRAATLTCDNLVAQFETVRSRDTDRDGPSPLSRATNLKAFWARRNVSLVDREAKVQRSADASLIYYDGQSGDARITGTSQQPAVIKVDDPQTGRSIVYWQGQEVTWNLNTDEIRTEKSQILAPGR